MSTPARMIRPLTIGSEEIVSTTATDPTPAWDVVTPYARDAEVHRGETVYISRVSSNLGSDPALDDGTKWAANGPINPLAMFDGATSTQTEATSPLVVVLQLSGWID